MKKVLFQVDSNVLFDTELSDKKVDRIVSVLGIEKSSRCDLLAKDICQYYNVSVSAFYGKSSLFKVRRARKIFLLACMDYKISIRDVAAHLGRSHVTVSKYLKVWNIEFIKKEKERYYGFKNKSEHRNTGKGQAQREINSAELSV